MIVLIPWSTIFAELIYAKQNKTKQVNKDKRYNLPVYLGKRQPEKPFPMYFSKNMYQG